MSSPYWRESDGSAVPGEDAVRLWAAEAYDILVDIAGRYQATISPAELARRVQDRSGVRTKQAPGGWLGRVIQLVAHRCHATEEPPLTALVVNPTDGKVGAVYAEVLRVQRKPVGNDLTREREAASARLAAYRRYAKHVPASATPAAASERVTARVTKPASPRPRRTAPTPPKPPVPTTRICPRCFLETPLDGECQNCV